MKLSEQRSIILWKANNGVVLRPDYGRDDRMSSSTCLDEGMLVFDSAEPFMEWAREFFPKDEPK